MNTYLIAIQLLIFLSGCCYPPQDVERPCVVEKKQVDCQQVQPCEGPLTSEDVVRLALMQNATLQAEFERIGISRGELINACLYTNPHLSFDVRFPDKKNEHVDSEVIVTTSLLDFFLKPLQQKAASLNYQKSCLEAGYALLTLTADVREACYAYQYQLQKKEYLEQLLTLASAAKELALSQQAAGNINSFTVQKYLSSYYGAVDAIQNSELGIQKAREKLNRLMGLKDNQEGWSLSFEATPKLDEQTANIAHLQQRALEDRLDLQAASMEVQRISKVLNSKQWWAYTDARIGISSEHEPENFRVTGPIAEISLPLFNYGQGDRYRLLAELQVSQDEYEALEVSALSQVREAYQRMEIALQRVRLYANEILPMHEQQIALAMRQYNFMTLGAYDVFDSKRLEIQARIDFLQALYEYRTAQALLTFATGH